MEVRLKNFKCWEDQTFTFPIGQFHLIIGDTGAGKSTIFKAIWWALYGQVTKVAPRWDPNCTTSVTLTCPGPDVTYTVFRQRGPGLLRVTTRSNGSLVEKVYEDQEAQEIINQWCGQMKVCQASAYLGQRCTNYFLESSNQGKMELLTLLLNSRSDLQKMDKLFSTVQGKLQETKEGFAVTETLYNRQLVSFQKISDGVDTSWARSPEDVREREQDVRKCRDDLRELELRIAVQKEQQQRKQVWERELAHLVCPDIPILPLPRSEIMALLEQVKRREYLSSEVQTIEAALEKIPELPELPAMSYTQAVEKWQKYLRWYDVVTELAATDPSLDLATADDYRSKLETLAPLLTERQKLRGQLQKPMTNPLTLQEEELLATSIPSPIPVDLLPEPEAPRLATLEDRKRLADLQQERSMYQGLQCPACRVQLHWHAHQKELTLEADPRRRDELESEIARLTTEIQRSDSLEQEYQHYRSEILSENRKLQQQYHQACLQYQKQLGEQKKLELRRKEYTEHLQRRSVWELELQDVLDKIQKIGEITIPEHAVAKQLQGLLQLGSPESWLSFLEQDPPVDPEWYRMQQEQQELIQKREKMKEELTTLPSGYNKVDLERSIMAYDRAWHLYTVWEERKNHLEVEIQKIPDPKGGLEKDLVDAHQKIVTLEQELSWIRSANTVVQEYQKLTEEYQKLQDYHQRLGSLSEFREYAVEAECRLVQSTVDQINQTLEDICGQMFDETITVRLCLHKTVKSDGRMKPSVNFTVYYKGGEFDKLSEVSCGEEDRIAIALTVAWCILSPAPFLLLDESDSALDPEKKLQLHEVLRNYLGPLGKTVLSIRHEGVQGVYDTVLDVAALRG